MRCIYFTRHVASPSSCATEWWTSSLNFGRPCLALVNVFNWCNHRNQFHVVGRLWPDEVMMMPGIHARPGDRAGMPLNFMNPAARRAVLAALLQCKSSLRPSPSVSPPSLFTPPPLCVSVSLYSSPPSLLPFSSSLIPYQYCLKCQVYLERCDGTL